MAGTPLGVPPTVVTNTSKEDPDVGTGVHRKAHPMIQPATVVVNGPVVALPCVCRGVSSKRAGPDAAAATVEEVVVPAATATVVVVTAPDDAVVVVVVLAAPDGGGSAYALLFDEADEPTVR
jgi:hypothetical protein